MKIILSTAFALGLAGFAAANAAQHDPVAPVHPRRVLSMNVCVDQYLVALADRDQIVALSNYARDSSMSYYASRAAQWPVSSGAVEEVLALKPDLIIGGSARRQGPVAQLRKFGFPIVEVKPADDYKTIVKQTRQIAKALGHPERGEALIRQMDGELAAIPTRPGPKPIAAYYQRRGYLTGTGTLVDEIMQRAGFRNLAADLGRKSVTRMPLETIVQSRPDYLIMESAADPHADNGSALLFHPALEKVVPPSHRLSLPQAQTVCGGPFFPQAVQSLADQLRAHP
jgi:iron complex transport system substrate-binding protein